jgi:hypothetical protein
MIGLLPFLRSSERSVVDAGDVNILDIVGT